MRLRKYTLTENLKSALLGLVIAIPICISAYNNRIADSHTIETVSTEIKAVSSEVELIVQAEPTIERIALGEFKTTAYCPCPVCCGEWADGLTYTETVATEGRTIAVDPDVIPLGSIVEINGVEYVAEDIGGAIKDNRIDIFFSSHEDALEWGVQYYEIFLIQ